MKNAFWLLALAFAGLLVFAFSQVPPADLHSTLSVHVESRYQQKSPAETGISSPTLAVLADYRGLNLWAAAILFCAAALAIFLFFPHPSRSFSLLPSLLCLGVGALLLLGIGFWGLRQGMNFLDYEALAAWSQPAQARAEGAFLLLLGSALSLGGLLMLAAHWFYGGEAHSGR